MITWGQKANTNAQQWQSLGSIATGVPHVFTRFRTGSDGASLHPLQRQGVVGAESHNMNVRQTAADNPGIGDARRSPVPYTNGARPPLVPIASGQINPAVRI